METLLAHCTQAFAERGGLMLTFLMGGLTGGFTHCAVMCGPYVASARMCAKPCQSRSCAASVTPTTKQTPWARMSGGYHIGRILTYGALGALAAGFSKHLAAFSWWPSLSAAMLAMAGILFLLSCAQACHPENTANPLFKPLHFTRGLLLGFMPCGMVYAALMMAATLTNPIHGMLAMWLFGLGTLPALILVSIGADIITKSWQHTMQMVGRAMLACNGLSLLVMAARIMR